MLGAHQGGRAQGGGLDPRSCGHLSSAMFKKHLLRARLDQRLRTRVSKVLLVLEKLLIVGKEAHDLSINASERGGQVS